MNISYLLLELVEASSQSQLMAITLNISFQMSIIFLVSMETFSQSLLLTGMAIISVLQTLGTNL